MSKPLSPQAQAVAQAARGAYWLPDQECPGEPDAIAAAALRAAADQIQRDPKQSHQALGIAASRRQLLAIAAELEAGG
jgi:hypothetical protein